MEANIYRRFPLELQRYRKHFGSLLCPCPRWISILWFFWEILVEKYPQNDRNYLPVQYIFLHGHPDCWPRVRPLGKKSFHIGHWSSQLFWKVKVLTESNTDFVNTGCFFLLARPKQVSEFQSFLWQTSQNNHPVHIISNILWYHALADWDTGYLPKSFLGHSVVIKKAKVLTESSI